ncbi:hypothetical protein M9H77_14576 [Catharanthus roseus]|uniref:Uncharacterized protein n=1 Tax=Catharanthus roseus TaxID=4058 RepID=A0ACC0BNH3_CATRO|nr:hypothetical protein M9H77_14576 [Catharanthus roseus]
MSYDLKLQSQFPNEIDDNRCPSLLLPTIHTTTFSPSVRTTTVVASSSVCNIFAAVVAPFPADNFREPSENQKGKLGYNSIKTISLFPSNSYLFDDYDLNIANGVSCALGVEDRRSMETELCPILDDLSINISLNPSSLCYEICVLFLFLLMPSMSKCLPSHVSLENPVTSGSVKFDPPYCGFQFGNNGSFYFYLPSKDVSECTFLKECRGSNGFENLVTTSSSFECKVMELWKHKSYSSFSNALGLCWNQYFHYHDLFKEEHYKAFESHTLFLSFDKDESLFIHSLFKDHAVNSSFESLSRVMHLWNFLFQLFT